jgi:hypothetical protein
MRWMWAFNTKNLNVILDAYNRAVIASKIKVLLNGFENVRTASCFSYEEVSQFIVV